MSFIVPLLLSIGVIKNPPCSSEEISDILAEPIVIDEDDPDTWENRFANVSCSVQLQPGDLVTKSLRFIGPAANHLVFDCNGATISPLGALKEEEPALLVSSAKFRAGDDYAHEPVRNVTIKNCKVRGSTRVRSQFYRIGNEELATYKNERGPDYVRELRSVAPTGITFDNLDIVNGSGVSLYIEQGVTHTTLKNSRIKHDNAGGPSLYIDAEAAYNVVENNEFHHDSSNFREVLSIDGAEHNLITRNWFSGVTLGGVFLYRNCGERGEVRYTGVRNNEISDNIFYYQDAWITRPAVYVGSRDGDSLSGYCDKDSNVSRPWDISDVDPSFGWDGDWEASNTDDRDFARFNTVLRNKICNHAPDGFFKVKNVGFNFGNAIYDNRSISCDSSDPIPR
ncbi:right-handed parallel beta-helix repeat-containing protein [Microbulbifer taiwanensis]|uniref:right-handed parallel beta-helix repeat-containing protein n=1 Tax=Microbulbifer taiwanensis TaxID=986746 RepID=UPI001D020248|nr:right-handed parallel beta-helix repeat-containing protein [Microbulbifer taiwanensis]